MNLVELINYIDNLKAKKGELSRDDIYEIGLKHKALPQQDKNWSRLAELVGWEASAEALRSYVNHRMYKEGIMPKNENLISDKTVLDLDESDINTKKQELFKSQQKVRDEWSTYRRMLREDARIETFKDAIRGTVDKLNSMPYYSMEPAAVDKIRKLKTANEAILMISDLHIGVDCDNFYNTYNSAVAERRVMKLVDETIRYCRQHSVERLNVVNLGDLINGIIHTTIRLEQEFDVVDQIMTAGEIMSRALNKLQLAAPEIVYRGVTDNHSRAMASKLEAIEKEQFSRLIDWYLKERLKNTKIKFAEDNLDIDIGKFDLLNGKKVMFAHGHNDNANQAFQHFIGATKEFIDYVLLAHFHSEKLKNYQGMKVFVNGSIVGTEQYASSKRLYSDPAQSLLIFEDDNVLNISVNLRNA